MNTTTITHEDYDPAENSRRCYDLAIAALRELCIRRHQIAPSTPEERRWADEGERKPSELDAVRWRKAEVAA